MSTKIAIAMTRRDGTVAGLYDHWHDEPESVGRFLLDRCSDPHKLDELITQHPDVAPTIASDVEGFCSQLRRSGCEYFYLFDVGWSVSKPYGRWRALADVLARGVELLVEPDPDRGPDIQWSRGDTRSTWLVWPTSKMGRQWIRDAEGVDVDGLELDDEELAVHLDRMWRDGLIVEREEPQP
jgi:hypothetical protein